MPFKKWSAACAFLLFTACGPGEPTVPAAEALDSQTQNVTCEGCNPTGDDVENMGGIIPDLPPLPTTYSPYLAFYADNNCSDSFGTALFTDPRADPSNPISIPYDSGGRVTVSGWKNDEARSMKLLYWPAGVRIRICDDPNCATSDDWTDYRIKQATNGDCISTFESPPPYYDPDIGAWMPVDQSLSIYRDVYWHSFNGLDGKVSRILVERIP